MEADVIFKIHPLLILWVDMELQTSLNADGHSQLHLTGISVVPAETAVGSKELFPSTIMKGVSRGLNVTA